MRTETTVSMLCQLSLSTLGFSVRGVGAWGTDFFCVLKSTTGKGRFLLWRALPLGNGMDEASGGPSECTLLRLQPCDPHRLRAIAYRRVPHLIMHLVDPNEQVVSVQLHPHGSRDARLCERWKVAVSWKVKCLSPEPQDLSTLGGHTKSVPPDSGKKTNVQG